MQIIIISPLRNGHRDAQITTLTQRSQSISLREHGVPVLALEHCACICVVLKFIRVFSCTCACISVFVCIACVNQLILGFLRFTKDTTLNGTLFSSFSSLLLFHSSYKNYLFLTGVSFQE